MCQPLTETAQSAKHLSPIPAAPHAYATDAVELNASERNATTNSSSYKTASAPSAHNPRSTATDSTSTTTAPPAKSEDSSATDATEDSASHNTTPKHSQRQPPTSEDIAQLPERSQQIIKWRDDEGLSFGAIGKKLGVSRQRASQLWKLAQTAKPNRCHCGNLIPLNTEQGAPKTYCKPEHRPKRSRRPATCWYCDAPATLGGGTKWYCKPEHKPYRRFPHLTQGDYDNILAEQNHLCGICRQLETMLSNQGEIRAFAVDHCEATNTIRGLTCSNCNILLGFFDDDPNLLDRAAEYLRERMI